MTATFEKNGLRFLYPDSWTLAEYSDADEFHEVSLESPEGSIWSVSVFPAEAQPKQLIQSCLEALQDQYDDLEASEFEGEFNGFEASGFDADFYCLDFLVAAQSRTLQHNGKTFSFFCQAESREFEKNLDVFNAITMSLMKHESINY